MAKRTNLGRQAAFLAAFAECGNLSLSCQLSGVGRQTHYDWMRNPDYRLRWEEARDTAVDMLAGEARRRAMGIDVPVIYQGSLCYPRLPNGKRSRKPLTIRQYSDVLLMFLLKAARPDIYRDNWRGELVHRTDVKVAHEGPDLSRLTDGELNQLGRIIEAAQARSRGEEYPEVAGNGAENNGDPQHRMGTVVVAGIAHATDDSS